MVSMVGPRRARIEYTQGQLIKTMHFVELYISLLFQSLVTPSYLGRIASVMTLQDYTTPILQRHVLIGAI